MIYVLLRKVIFEGLLSSSQPSLDLIVCLLLLRGSLQIGWIIVK